MQKYLSSKSAALMKEKSTLADKRGSLISESVAGMKMVKFNAWESIIEAKIDDLRKKEEKNMFLIYIFRTIHNSVQYVSPKLSIFCILYFLWLSESTISIPTLYTIISIINSTTSPLRGISLYFNALDRAKVASKRITSILSLKEKATVKDSKRLLVGEIDIESASFSWKEPLATNSSSQNELEAELHNITIRINSGEFIGVVGEVGSGKSSLLLSIMGELHTVKGKVMKQGRFAYIPQEAFVINDTLKNNILFGEELHNERYAKILRLCELEHDIRILSAGDLTEIGELGINLSGGQKQRVSIARAVYSNNDIFVIDDSLSSLDRDVGNRIMDNLFCKELKQHTRIMSTHKLSFLDRFDRIIFIKDGIIQKIGSYQELQLNKEFQQFIHHRNDESPKEDPDADLFSPSVTTEKKNKTEINERLIMLEDSKKGMIETGTFAYYLKQAGFVSSIISMLFFLISNCYRMWVDYWLGRNLSLVFGPNSAIDMKLEYMLLLAFFFIILSIRGILFTSAVSNASYRLYKKMIKNLLHRPMSYFDKTSSGIIMNRCNNDALNVDDKMSLSLLVILNLGSLFAVVLFVASIYTYVSILISLLFCWLIYGYFRRFLLTAIPISRMRRVASSPVLSKFNELLIGSVSMRIFNKQDFFMKQLKDISNLDSLVFLHDTLVDAWLSTRVDFGVFFLTSTFIISLTIAKLQGFIEEDSIASAGLILVYVLMLSDTIRNLMVFMSSIMKEASSVERIHDFTMIEEREDEFIKNTIPPNWPSIGKIEIKDLRIRYSPTLPLILNGIDLSIKGGEKIGIIGRTGSGKSTLLLALFRIIEAEGDHPSILIDDFDIKKLGLHELRRNLVIIPQEPFLMEGSLRFNLDPFDQYTEEEILTCLEMTGVMQIMTMGREKLSFISLKDAQDDEDNELLIEDSKARVKAFLDYSIEPKGANLSVGQRQLISIT